MGVLMRSNLRPLTPQASALSAELRAHRYFLLAGRVGFEPTVEVLAPTSA